jgi:hypothetical protein
MALRSIDAQSTGSGRARPPARSPHLRRWLSVAVLGAPLGQVVVDAPRLSEAIGGTARALAAVRFAYTLLRLPGAPLAALPVGNPLPTGIARRFAERAV